MFRLFDSRPSKYNIVRTSTEVINPTHISPCEDLLVQCIHVCFYMSTLMHSSAFPGSVQFTIEPSDVSFLDTNPLLQMVFQVKKKKDGIVLNLDAVSKDDVAVVNGYMAAAFSSISVALNGTPIETHSNHSYPYTVSFVHT